MLFQNLVRKTLGELAPPLQSQRPKQIVGQTNNVAGRAAVVERGLGGEVEPKPLPFNFRV
jgi:hypothetical protein